MKTLLHTIMQSITEEVKEIEEEVYDYTLFLLVAFICFAVFGGAFYVISSSRKFVRNASDRSRNTDKRR